MKIAAVRFVAPVEDANGKPIQRLQSAVLKDGLVRAGSKRYPVHMVASFTAVDICPVCGDPMSQRALARGNKVCSRSCAGRSKKPRGAK